jgi:sulfoxide reductase heme-binding subunit YedZ
MNVTATKTKARKKPVWRWPWNDRAGRFSWLKAITFALVLLPGIWIAVEWITVGYGPRAVNSVIHEVGKWSVRFLLITLAITPARRILNWPQLINIRRMLGLTALAYALVHFTLYIIDQNFRLGFVASEIVFRFYLTIGFIALLGLCVLGITSTDNWIKRLGKRWNTLHRIIYVIAVLALLHHFLQAKVDVDIPVLMTGFFIWEMSYRLLRRWVNAPGAIWLTVLAIISAIGTAAVEVGWYAVKTGVKPGRVFAANFDFSYTIRPAWWVLAAGLAVVVLYLARRFVPTSGNLRNRTAGPNVARAE